MYINTYFITSQNEIFYFSFLDQFSDQNDEEPENDYIPEQHEYKEDERKISLFLFQMQMYEKKEKRKSLF